MHRLIILIKSNVLHVENVLKEYKSYENSISNYETDIELNPYSEHWLNEHILSILETQSAYVKEVIHYIAKMREKLDLLEKKVNEAEHNIAIHKQEIERKQSVNESKN